jgi:dihydropteroate synthase
VILEVGSRKLDFSKIYVMGIMNLTLDSFYPASRVRIDEIGSRALRMVHEGADIIDIGAESTRPGSEPADPTFEEAQIEKAVKLVREVSDLPISIDTYRSKTAMKGIKAGANMVNDISGLNFDPAMAKVCAELDVPVVLMHIRGTPRDMQIDPHYDDVVREVHEELERSMEIALKHGVKESKLIIDPGIGFGKRLEDNLNLIAHLEEFKDLGKPILIGISRKSMISKIMPMDVDERLEPTIALNVIAAMKGASIVRVHDVSANVKAMRMVDAIMEVK